MLIRVRGNPVAQGRPRFFRRGNFVNCYDPKKSKDWKSVIKRQAIEQGAKSLEGALSLKTVFYLQRPKSLSKKVTHHIKRPDLDNLVKAVKDGLKGICFHDDSQIISIHAMKMYATNFIGVEITIHHEI